MHSSLLVKACIACCCSVSMNIRHNAHAAPKMGSPACSALDTAAGIFFFVYSRVELSWFKRESPRVLLSSEDVTHVDDSHVNRIQE